MEKRLFQTENVVTLHIYTVGLKNSFETNIHTNILHFDTVSPIQNWTLLCTLRTKLKMPESRMSEINSPHRWEFLQGLNPYQC